MREERERQRKLTLRHRWYAGGIATVLSGALIFAGVGPATAAEVTPPPADSSTTDTPAPTPPADATTPPADASTPPADSTTPPAATTPPSDATTPPADTPAATPTPSTTPTPTPSPSASAPLTAKSLAADTTVSPQSLVDPTPVAAGKTTLQIKKLGARLANGSVSSVAGAVFYAVDGTRGGARPTPGTTTSLLTCTTDANGLCQIVVDARTGGNGGNTQGYWVFEGVAPSGWNRLGQLGLGDYDSTKTPTPYIDFTNNVSGSSTIWEVPGDATAYFGTGTSATTKTDEKGFANVRSNPTFPNSCGLSIAMVFDTSGSINSTEMTQMKNAAKSFVAPGALGGTPSSVALYRFSTTASKFLNLTSIAASQTTVNNAIDGLPASGNDSTNWDDAFRKVAFNGSENYDVVILLTDGDPTVMGTNGANGETNVGFRNIEEGVFSANAVKSMTGPAGSRTKIVAVGIGLAGNSYLNLAAVSGPTVNEDYYTTDFANLATKLNQIAQANCAGTLTVVKKTVDGNGNTIDATAGGWTFTGSTSGAWIQTGGGNVSSLALTTPNSGASKGAVNFPIDLAGTSSRTVTVAETAQAGWTATNVTCTGASPTGSPGSFSVPVGVNAVVSCTVTNQQDAASLTLVKSLTNNNGGTATVGSWTLTAAGPTTISGASGSAAVKLAKVAPGTYALSESGPAGYTLTSLTCDSGVTVSAQKTITLAKNQNVTCTFVNDDNPAKLTIVKQDMSGNGLAGAVFQLWKETGAAAGLQTSGGNADTLVNGSVTAGTANLTNLSWGTYYVKEITAPPGYDLATPDTQTVVLGAAETTTAAVVTFKDPLKPSTLTLVKVVDNKGVGTHAATEWTLTAAGTGGFSQPGTSSDGGVTASTGKKNVQPNTAYTLSETGPAGYDASSWSCDSNITVSGGRITLAPGDDVTCTIKNTVRTHDVKLVKKWVGAIAGDKATLTAGAKNATSTATAAAEFTDNANAITVTVAEGAAIVLSETLPGANAGTYGTAFACTAGSVTGGDRSYTLTVPNADTTCTFTNTANTVTVSLTKSWATGSFAGDKAGLAITRGGDTLTSATSTAPASATISQTVRVGDVVSLAETLPGANTGSYAATWVCDDGRSGSGLGTSFTVTKAVSCTITNTPRTITVRVDKQWVNAFPGDDAVLTVNGQNGPSVADTSNETDANVVVATVRVGDSVAISESLTTNTGTYDAKWKCGPNGTFAAGSSIPSFTASVDVTCTLQNTARTHTVKLQKQWVDAIKNDTASLVIGTDPAVTSTAGGEAGSWIDPAGFATKVVRVGDSVALHETVNAASGSQYSSSYSCTPGALNGAGQSFALTVPDSDVVCTFTNTNLRGKITLRKDVVNDNGGTAIDTQWTLTATGVVVATGAEGAPAVTGAFVPAGVYTLAESGGPTGYAQTDLACTGGQFTPATGGTPASVAVAAGADVVCTFRNDDIAPTLTLVKNVANNGVGVHGATEWTLSASGELGFQDALTTGTATTASTGAKTVKAGVAYQLSEQGPAGYNAGAWSCTAGQLNAGAVTLAVGQNAVCQITNTAAPASGDYTKEVVSTTQIADGPNAGKWQITYKVTVTNTSVASTFVYDLVDSLEFPAEIEPQSAVVTSAPAGLTPTFDTTTWTSQLATDRALPQNTDGTNATDVYTIVVVAAIPDFPGADDDWQSCADGGGFLNRAVLTHDDRSSDPETACSEPSFPTILKTGKTSVQDAATGAWTLSYDIVVTNPGDVAVQAEVTDAFPTAPADWTLTGDAWGVTSADVTPTAASFTAGGPAQSIWAGSLPAGESYTFTVTGIVTPSGDATAIGPCDDEEGGLLNTATVWSGEGSASDVGCADTDVATVTVTKDAKSVSQNPDGSWLVTYVVAVENPAQDDAQLTAVYDLVDAPRFGTGITPTGLRWAPADSTGAPTGAFSASTSTYPVAIANGKPLADGATDYYVVEVTADIAADAWAEDGGVIGLTCPTPGEGIPDPQGLLNTATATAGDDSETGYDCIVPNLPTVTKTPVSAVKNPEQDPGDPDLWRVSYLLTVTPHGTDTHYDLADVPGFATGVNLVSGTAVRIDTDPDGTPVSDIPSDGTPFVTGVALGGSDEPHEWLVTWLVEIPNQIPPALRDCTEGGTQGHGFYNAATLTVSDVEQNADTCVNIEEKVYPDVTKTATGLSRDPDTKIWEITYSIVVTLPDSEDVDGEGDSLNPGNLSAKYDLVEALEFGDIDLLDAAWTGHDSGSFGAGATTASLANNEPIAAGATHTYTVKVHARIQPGDLVNHTVGCETQSRQTAVGFFNKVTLTSDDALPVVREACTEPSYPKITKVAQPVERVDGGLQRISYLIRVKADPAVDGKPVTNVIYSLSEQPDPLPAGVERVGEWHAEKVGDGPTPSQDTWNGVGPWLVKNIAGFSAADRSAGRLEHVYRVWADVKVTAAPTPDQLEGLDDCNATFSGFPLWNRVQLSSGEYSDTGVDCTEVNYDDVSITKTALLPLTGDGTTRETSVQPNDVFDYVLTVTNNGTAPATHVRVTDTSINQRLGLLALAVAGGHTYTGGILPAASGHGIDLTLTDTLAVGASFTVTIQVKFLPSPTPDVSLIPGAEPPALPDPLEKLDNTACVAADFDTDPDNNCADASVPTRDITATLYATCVSDAPLLSWELKKSSLVAGLPAKMTWTPDSGSATTDPASVVLEQPNASDPTWSDTIGWPGAEFTPSGVAIDYPGWRALRASDYAPGGGYYLPGTTTVMTPAQEANNVFNGLILDDSELDYAWRGNTTITFSVNPTLVFHASYPPATPECFSARHTELDIQKTASVEKTEPGKSFTYSIDVANVSADSAASNVVVTDAIPKDIKVTNVTWAGKGDGATFPNWTTCAVTGQDASGFGGTLTCSLFGPLQPADSTDGAKAAPRITLTASVNPASKASVITNVAVVDYTTFGDPDDPGRDADDATVLLSGLPVTGGGAAWPLAMLGFLALLGGVTALVVMRRRKGEAKADL
ncbi:SpaA isopeptide-forming pilin-related protein [Microbacterium sp. AZCO]|uniref:SpaA isopeptide-forming pilin-related protein n=1 Tax=Microbacterium sp. AZCO TaxID=3142976 RepID=UPI0031F4709E